MTLPPLIIFQYVFTNTSLTKKFEFTQNLHEFDRIREILTKFSEYSKIIFQNWGVLINWNGWSKNRHFGNWPPLYYYGRKKNNNLAIWYLHRTFPRSSWPLHQNEDDGRTIYRKINSPPCPRKVAAAHCDGIQITYIEYIRTLSYYSTNWIFILEIRLMKFVKLVVTYQRWLGGGLGGREWEGLH